MKKFFKGFKDLKKGKKRRPSFTELAQIYDSLKGKRLKRVVLSSMYIQAKTFEQWLKMLILSDPASKYHKKALREIEVASREDWIKASNSKDKAISTFASEKLEQLKAA